jgi:hypothetical protein
MFGAADALGSLPIGTNMGTPATTSAMDISLTAVRRHAEDRLRRGRDPTGRGIAEDYQANPVDRRPQSQIGRLPPSRRVKSSGRRAARERNELTGG